MKLKFKAAAHFGLVSHVIEGETINGIDLSPIDNGGHFIGNETTQEAGIRDAYRDAEGVLHVTLIAPVLASRLPGRKAHWRGSDVEFDAKDYVPGNCYVVPTGVADLNEGLDYRTAWREGFVAGEAGWTIEPVKEFENE